MYVYCTSPQEVTRGDENKSIKVLQKRLKGKEQIQNL